MAYHSILELGVEGIVVVGWWLRTRTNTRPNEEVGRGNAVRRRFNFRVPRVTRFDVTQRAIFKKMTLKCGR